MVFWGTGHRGRSDVIIVKSFYLERGLCHFYLADNTNTFDMYLRSIQMSFTAIAAHRLVQSSA